MKVTERVCLNDKREREKKEEGDVRKHGQSAVSTFRYVIRVKRLYSSYHHPAQKRID
jgi:hypothetical protein